MHSSSKTESVTQEPFSLSCSFPRAMMVIFFPFQILYLKKYSFLSWADLLKNRLKVSDTYAVSEKKRLYSLNVLKFKSGGVYKSKTWPGRRVRKGR